MASKVTTRSPPSDERTDFLGPALKPSADAHRDRGALTLGPDAFLSEEQRVTLDVNVIVLLSKRLSLFTNVQNAFNAPQLTMAAGSLTPHYASRRLTATSGTIVIMGIKGSF